MKNIFSKKNRALISELVRTDFKLRYQGSVLGYAWSLLRPLLLFTTLYIIFIKFLKFDFGIPHPQVYLLLGIVIWTFFSEMTSMSLGSIVERGELIRKIKIPRWIIVLSSSISAIISLGLNILIVTAFVLINGVELRPEVILLPLVLFQVYILAVGLSFFLSAAFVKYRDVSYIWEVLLQIAFYATPILYPLSRITNVTAQKLLFVNPMAQTIQDARYLLVSNQVTTIGDVYGTNWARLIPYGITIVVFIIGVIVFRKESKYFAENI